MDIMSLFFDHLTFSKDIFYATNVDKNGDYLMHHKFCIIDNNIVMTGSFNWTMQAIMGNNENVIITSELEVVNPFVSEFEKLWNEYDPKR